MMGTRRCREPCGGLSLADRVLQAADVVEQGPGEDGLYKLKADPAEAGDSGEFSLDQDDFLMVIGNLNSSDGDSARRSFRQLLGRLDRPAMEGLAFRFYSALREQERELAGLRSHVRHGGRQGVPKFHEGNKSKRREPSPHHHGAEQPKGDIAASQVPPDDDLPDVFKRLTQRPEIPDLPVHTAVPLPTAPAPFVEYYLPDEKKNIDQDSKAEEEVFFKSPTVPEAEAQRIFDRLHKSATYPKSLHLAQRKIDHAQKVEDDCGRRSPRLPETEAQQVFDRLHKSAKEVRVKKRTDVDFGIMAEEVRSGQSISSLSCTPPLPGDALLNNQSVRISNKSATEATERLYKESTALRQRRQELQANAPRPSFRPQIKNRSANENSRSQPTHLRLFCDHLARQQRQEQRQEDLADWKKHSYRPDIMTSQASGPRILRAQSQQQFRNELEDHLRSKNCGPSQDPLSECLSAQFGQPHERMIDWSGRSDTDGLCEKMPMSLADERLSRTSSRMSSTSPSHIREIPRDISGIIKCSSPVDTEYGSAVMVGSARERQEEDAGDSTSPPTDDEVAWDVESEKFGSERIHLPQAEDDNDSWQSGEDDRAPQVLERVPQGVLQQTEGELPGMKEKREWARRILHDLEHRAEMVEPPTKLPMMFDCAAKR